MTEVEERVKLSQWDALLMESLRVLGWSDDEIIQRTKQGELPKEDTSMYQFNYEELTAFATQASETFEAAVRTGYQIKYNTIRGIRSWIHIAYKLEPELVLDAGNESVIAELTLSQKERLASVLSHGWAIQGEHAGAAEEASRYVIVPQG
ncbi:hypothetical protein [Paenibacillus sp. OV219]|uniref:hypothetical protein n=1 Tax=Paenibacillus sp. OV219 TaxID=1884377 RepID=UPI0008B619E6|nr:hypothetical protein [Paenibacillus sp. OV219]SEO33041.1 hypothetical protein SAMN05518847_107112 [Paenibacillus sp. OV219]